MLIDEKELVQKFKELIEDDEAFLTFIRLYAPELPQRLLQENVIRSVCSHPKDQWKNTPWGYKICGLCNDIVEQTDV